jgi:hypothetical protein
MTSVVWTADFLPDDIGCYMSQAIEAGMAAMQRSLDRLAAQTKSVEAAETLAGD